MAITEKQKQLVQESYIKVDAISEQAAEIFYGKLFEFDPSLKPLFKNNMKDQGKKLMAALKLAVKSLDDLNGLVPVLENMAVKHVDYGVKVEDYTPVGNALIQTLEAGLGDDFTPELRAAWVEVYRTMANVMRSKAYPGFDPDTFQNKKVYNK